MPFSQKYNFYVLKIFFIFVCSLLIYFFSFQTFAETKKIFIPPKKKQPVFEIVIDGEPLYFVTNSEYYSAQERAGMAMGRIVKVAKDTSLNTKKIEVD